MIRLMAFMLILLGLLVLHVDTAAQTNMTPTPTPDPNCPQLVRKALDLTKTNCTILGRNQVCYGHSEVQASSRFEAFRFEQPGDIEEVISLQSLSLSAMSIAQQVWGVMLMQVQAGLQLDSPDNVTMVFFGDTELNARAQVLEVRVEENVNSRVQPSPSAALQEVLPAGATVYANARTDDSLWIRVQLNRETIRSGWVLASLVQTDESLDLLPVVDPMLEDIQATFGPMQAFYFQSGKDDAPCEEAPNSGLLIQTPEGAASVTIWIDEVVIELNATAFLQAQPNGTLDVNVIEGFAKVTALSETQLAMAGTSVSVELDEDLNADSVPSSPEPFNPDDLKSLPTELLMREVTVPEPFDPTAGIPASGRWSFTVGARDMSCGAEIVPFVLSEGGVDVSTQDNGATLTLSDGGTSFTLNRAEKGRYTLSYISVEGEGDTAQTILYEQVIEVVSATEATGFTNVYLPTCSFTIPFTMGYGS